MLSDQWAIDYQNSSDTPLLHNACSVTRQKPGDAGGGLCVMGGRRLAIDEVNRCKKTAGLFTDQPAHVDEPASHCLALPPSPTAAAAAAYVRITDHRRHTG